MASSQIRHVRHPIRTNILAAELSRGAHNHVAIMRPIHPREQSAGPLRRSDGPRLRMLRIDCPHAGRRSVDRPDSLPRVVFQCAAAPVGACSGRRLRPRAVHHTAAGARLSHARRRSLDPRSHPVRRRPPGIPWLAARAARLPDLRPVSVRRGPVAPLGRWCTCRPASPSGCCTARCAGARASCRGSTRSR